MTTFHDLLQTLTASPEHDGALDLAQQRLDERFGAAVAATSLRLWSPGDPIPARGRRLLIGVATWSAYDMELLDCVGQAMTSLAAALTIDVFNVADCPSPEAIDWYVPGCGGVIHTPVVGYWSDGRLIDQAAGKAGRDLASRIIGFRP
jgi:hypothetical protein